MKKSLVSYGWSDAEIKKGWAGYSWTTFMIFPIWHKCPIKNNRNKTYKKYRITIEELKGRGKESQNE